MFISHYFTSISPWNISYFKLFRISTWNWVKLFWFHVEIESKFTYFTDEIKWNDNFFIFVFFVKYVEIDSKTRFFLFHFLRNLVKSNRNKAKSLTNRNFPQFPWFYFLLVFQFFHGFKNFSIFFSYIFYLFNLLFYIFRTKRLLFLNSY